MNHKEFFSKLEETYKKPMPKNVFLAGCGVLLLLVVFQTGVTVGFHKASFSYGWGDNYYKTFEGQRGPRMMGAVERKLPRDGMPGGHGAVGKIIKITFPSIIILGSDGVEKVVTTNSQTEIHRMRDIISVTDLAEGDGVVVIGAPDPQSQIVAKFIRVVSAPVQSATSTPLKQY